MAAEKKTDGGSPFGRFKERVAEARGTTAHGYARGRAFGPFIRLAQPANDNRMPASLVVLRLAVIAALIGLVASMIL